MRIVIFIFSLSLLTLLTTHSYATPVYVAKDSQVYHHDRSCSHITTTDGLMEFSSPQQAKASGSILCEHCDPSANYGKNENNQKRQSSGSRNNPQTDVVSNGKISSDNPNDGERHEYKTKTWPSGKTYVGEMKNGQKHGHGTLTFPKGTKIVGTWKDGVLLNGTSTCPNGSKYVGMYKDGKMHGNGTLTLHSGTKVVGEWKDGVLLNGARTYPNGSKYVGMYKDGKMHGNGALTLHSGTKVVGEWKDGFLLNGTLTYPNGDKYTGDFSKNWAKHGYGTYIWANGNKYVGEWKNNKQYDPRNDEFKLKNKVKAWPSMDELFSNPFVYEGKVIAISVYFAKMVSATSGIFIKGGDEVVQHIIVSNIPKGLFTTSEARVVILGKVLGNTESTVPIFGSMQVPHLKFIDYLLPDR